MEEGVVTRIKELAQEADKVQTVEIGGKTFTVEREAEVSVKR